MIVFGGALAAMGKGSFLAAVLCATAGSGLGFVTMYLIGRWLGQKVETRGKLFFVSVEAVAKIGEWFSRYGYWLIVGNRFLTGTRAFVAFFAGMSRLDLFWTTVLSFISSFAWNLILVYGGYSLGQHWETVGMYLATYSKIVTGVIVFVALVFLIRHILRKRRRSSHG